MKKIRDKIFISNSTWCLIQSVVLVLGLVCVYLISLAIMLATKSLWLDIPIILCVAWICVFMWLKTKVEDKFSDCIDS